MTLAKLPDGNGFYSSENDDHSVVVQSDLGLSLQFFLT